MGLRDIGATLPPGFRFYPSDEELVCHYLHNKIINEESLNKSTLIEIDLHICEPWQLPEVAKLNTSEWYFFSFRDRKYATGFRTNRATTCGYWKATGKDRVILDPKTKIIVGMRKTLVFYRNRAPNGTKTGWIMHEFRLECPHMPPKEDWVLCRVFHRGKTSLENNNNIINNNNNQGQYMLDNNMANNNNNNNNNNNTISPSLLITSPPPSSNTTNYYHQSIPYEGQKPYTFSSNNSPSFSQNKPTMINHNISSRYYDEKTSLNGNNGFLQLLKEEDDCEYMWDMNMEENGSNKLGEEGSLLQHGVFEDVRFEDNNISTIFI